MITRIAVAAVALALLGVVGYRVHAARRQSDRRR